MTVSIFTSLNTYEVGRTHTCLLTIWIHPFLNASKSLAHGMAAISLAKLNLQADRIQLQNFSWEISNHWWETGIVQEVLFPQIFFATDWLLTIWLYWLFDYSLLSKTNLSKTYWKKVHHHNRERAQHNLTIWESWVNIPGLHHRNYYCVLNILCC